MTDNPTYAISRIGVNEFNVFKDERYIGGIKKWRGKFMAINPAGANLGVKPTLGGALDVVIEGDG